MSLVFVVSHMNKLNYFPQLSVSSVSSSSPCLSLIMGWFLLQVWRICVDPLCPGWTSTALCLRSDPVSPQQRDQKPLLSRTTLWCHNLCFFISLSGSEFTPSPEHHHSHPHRPHPAAWAGHPRRHPGGPGCCPGPLLTARQSGQSTPHVTCTPREMTVKGVTTPFSESDAQITHQLQKNVSTSHRKPQIHLSCASALIKDLHTSHTNLWLFLSLSRFSFGRAKNQREWRYQSERR